MREAHYYRGWIPPAGFEEMAAPQLKIYNSLTDRKEVFVPKGGPHSKKLTWYSCGPTVYDTAHMGHSRNYVTIDILRRVMEDYFGYSILFVMNITDVDDKIVLKARRNYLLKQYQQQATDISQVRKDAESAIANSLSSQQRAVSDVRGQVQLAEDARAQAAAGVQQAKEAQEGLSAAEQQRRKKDRQLEDLQAALENEVYKLTRLEEIQSELTTGFPAARAKAESGDMAGAVQKLISIAGDQLASWQDNLYSATVTDEHIFRKHAAKYEQEFWQDMEMLGTRRPTVLTRVTEYMPQIVDYIQRIMDNGFAYASPEGSVYFDTDAFEHSGHLYPKLNPWAAGSAALAAEGEANFATQEKKNPRDFALWKACKPGEPSWESPWGRGRPGWHIECSAMASAIIGDKMDIHTGGRDLRFPHHDNELAQAEAYYHPQCGCSGQWVNYFLHSGHLNINGLKMSKSLKNFITIREALRDFSARQLRLMFAMQPWNKEMMFGKTMREEMRAKEHLFKHFFQNVEVLLRKHTPVLAMEEVELELEQKIDEAREAVHESLLDNINTAGALDALAKLVAATNKYTKQREADRAASSAGPAPHPHLLYQAAGLVTRILRVFGISTAAPDQLGFGGPGLTVSKEQLLRVFRGFRESVASSLDTLEVCSNVDLDGDSDLSNASPANLLDALTQFRSDIRECAKKHRLTTVLEDCDRIRDRTMVDLGIRLEDRPDGSSGWLVEDPAELRAEVQEREQVAKAAELSKRRKALDDKKRLLAKVEKQAALPTVQEALRAKSSRFDKQGQEGNPTHDADGNALDAGGLKAGKAAADKARKLRAFYDKQVAEKGPSYLHNLQHECEQAQREVDQLSAKTNGTS